MALGLPAGSETLAAALTFKLEDVGIDVTDQQEDTAAARLSGTLSITIDEAQASDLVRAMVEVDGEQIDDEELDFIVPLMLEALSEPQAIDDELTLVRTDGEWLVCGGFGDGDGGEPTFEDSISFDGICGLVSLAEVNAIGPAELRYDSSDGAEDYCSYSSYSAESYYSTSLSLGRGESLELYESFYPEARKVTVAGLPALQAETSLMIELAEGVLMVDIYPGDEVPADFDVLAYGERLAELFIPLIPGLEASQSVGFDTEGPSLCDAISIEQLTELSGLAFDDAYGDGSYCDYSDSTADVGFYVITTSLEPYGLDDFSSFFPGGQDLTVAGKPAYAESDQLWVELDDGPTSFGVGVYFEDSPGADGLDQIDLMRRIAERAIPAVLAATDPEA